MQIKRWTPAENSKGQYVMAQTKYGRYVDYEEVQADIQKLIEILDECHKNGVRTYHHEIKEKYK